MPTAPTRSYRCHYNPKDNNGWPITCESGVLPFIQVKADDAEHAVRVAHALIQCSIAEVQRIEPDNTELLDTADDRHSPRRFTGQPITNWGALE